MLFTPLIKLEKNLKEKHESKTRTIVFQDGHWHVSKLTVLNVCVAGCEACKKRNIFRKKYFYAEDFGTHWTCLLSKKERREWMLVVHEKTDIYSLKTIYRNRSLANALKDCGVF